MAKKSGNKKNIKASKKALSVDVKSMRKLSTTELARAVGASGRFTQTGSCWSYVSRSCCNSC